jgi:hypothetical protein
MLELTVAAASHDQHPPIPPKETDYFAYFHLTTLPDQPNSLQIEGPEDRPAPPNAPRNLRRAPNQLSLYLDRRAPAVRLTRLLGLDVSRRIVTT